MSSAEPVSSIPTCHSGRIAISGIGMVTSGGFDRESSWQSLISGASRLRWLSDEEHLQVGCDPSRTRLAGAPAILGSKQQATIGYSGAQTFSTSGSKASLPSVDSTLFDSMLFPAAEEAAVDAGFDNFRLETTAGQFERRRIGLVIGTSKGSLAAVRQMSRQLAQERAANSPVLDRLNSFPESWRDCWPNSPASHLAAKWDIRGPVLTPVAACATGMASICRGAELIRNGVCDLVFAGSVDDSISEIIWASYRRLGVLSRIQDNDPATACRPFDRDRTGFLMGSGAAVIALERWDSALSRGHRPYAEWLAGGTLSDATALTQVSTDAAGLTRLIRDLLKRGNVQPQDLDYINLHGTGTRDNDRYETQAVRQALGGVADQVPCSSLKGTIGHLLGGAGSVEFAATVLALRDGIIPPTCNLDHPAPECDLDYTPRIARQKKLNTALKLSLGFGGHLVGGLIRRE